jgi:hypothetical protein
LRNDRGILTIMIKGGIERRGVTTEYEEGRRKREGMDPAATTGGAL